MSKYGIRTKCSVCHKTGHNKKSCPKNPEKGVKKNAFLVKRGRKIKTAELTLMVSSVQANLFNRRKLHKPRENKRVLQRQGQANLSRVVREKKECSNCNISFKEETELEVGS